jgi:tetratricopeptide (TPR) repeat protein
MRSRLTPFLKLFYNPLEAMIEISAGAPYFVGGILALIATFAYYESLSRKISGVLPRIGRGRSIDAAPVLIAVNNVFGSLIEYGKPVMFVVLLFVPACLLASSIVHRRASFTVLLRQEFNSIVSCALYAWAAAHLIMLIPSIFLFNPRGEDAATIVAALRLVPLPYFVFLFTVAIHVVLRAGYASSLGVVALGSLSFFLLPLLPRLSFVLTSPFLLILVFIVLRNFFGEMMSTQRARENFQRNLQTATLNPADASAHYNLGLIYQQRNQIEEAKKSFERAIEIDPEETDAHYQLGRIAREQGRLGESITHFDAVVTRNSDHSLSEVWREIGRTYFQAEQYEDARNAFERFIDKRPSDAEGRYRYGLTLFRLGRAADAEDEMRTCIESVRTSPSYKYRTDKRWASQAQAFLKSQEEPK